MSRINAGSYTPTMESALGRQGIGGGAESEPTLPQTMPQARISRQFMLTDLERRDQWNDFIDYFAQKNAGTGTTNPVGSLAVTYFSAKTLGRAVESKHEDVFSRNKPKRREALNIYRSLSKDYRSFVEKNINKIHNDPECYGHSLSTQAELDAGTNPIAWRENNFAVNPGLVSIQDAKKRLGVVFSRFAEQRILEEMEATRVFLKDQGLPLSKLALGVPHITIVQSFHNADQVALKTPKKPQPTAIPLDMPKMLVFDNNRSS